MINRYEQFSYLISGIAKHIQKLERDEMIKYGLKGSFAQYLLAIARHEKGVTATSLGDICGKDKAAISRVLAEMEELGLIYRLLSGTNRYRAQLRLTDRGREIAEKTMAATKIAVEAAGKGVSDEERRVIYSVLDRISDNLQELSDNGISKRK